MRCEKCGTLIKDVNRPCPTCGMYIDNRPIDAKHSRLKMLCSALAMTAILLLIVSIAIFTNHKYNLKIVNYDNGDFMVDYFFKKWHEYEVEGNDNLTLKYNNGTSTYLVFASKIIKIDINLDDYEMRENLYQLQLTQFGKTPNVIYTNIMADIKPLVGTDYYYFTADFQDVTEKRNRGKTYYVYTNDGKCLVLSLILDNTNISHIDDDVFEMIKTLKL